MIKSDEKIECFCLPFIITPMKIYDPGKGYNSPMDYIPGDKLT
jgi:hypothetical protein